MTERNDIGFQWNDLRKGQGSSEVTISLSPGVLRPADHYDFASFIFGCTLDSALA